MYFNYFGFGPSAIVIFLLAVIAAALIAYFFLRDNRKDTYKGFMGHVSGLFNFTKYLVPLILKVLYAFATVYVILNGLFMVLNGSLPGLILLIVGPILVRIGFELTMLLYSIHEELVRVRKAAEGKAVQETRQVNP
jgi:hypothetical protein